MKNRKWILFLLSAVMLQSCLVGRFAWYNFSNITDHKIFPSRPLSKSNAPFRFTEAPKKERIGKARVARIDSMVAANNSVAFLIIRNDSILMERYYQQYDAGSTVASFSMAKSYTSALIGAALSDGFIKSVEEPITTYLTELKVRKGFDRIKIRHLLQMTSGIKSSESYYNPLGQAAKLYYGRNLRGYLSRLKTDYAPGTKFAYRSVNTQLLGLIVERATQKNVTDYMNEKIWSHLGAEYEATWSIDKKKNGLEKTFCCINAKARDFAKFGRLFLNEGQWNGQQLLPKEWINESTTSLQKEGAVGFYGYQWWISQKGFYADGLHGQFIYVNRSKNLIIVRLGKSEGKMPWPNFFDQLSEYL
ncbi:MAG: serine hydrolase domain-containing protein [Cyclobacteriaceae bacterium]|jgi:CubicO group peptidase (beta-lactamase class C family)|nr:beta-lactamase family protein [Flammeovirgaceae bacterium]